ncbi:MAG: hypothetical protein JOZ53_18435 [Planctomycetaceae bacterium]|nr:hypothetical protein [Planctomycetaceae bacterium]
MLQLHVPAHGTLLGAALSSFRIHQRRPRPRRKTLRYIHGNPRAAGFHTSFFYRSSNDASSARLSEDGLTQGPPAFLTLTQGPPAFLTLDECSARYRNFCRQDRPETKPKPRDTSGWGSQQLPQLSRERGPEPSEPPVPPGFGCPVTEPRCPQARAAVVPAWEQAQAPARAVVRGPSP